MKALILSLLTGVLVAGTCLASDYVTDSLNSQTITSRREMMIRTAQSYNSYQIVRGRVAYGGALIQGLKTKSSLGLITPAKLDGNEYNLDRDIITGRPVGFKFLTINF